MSHSWAQQISTTPSLCCFKPIHKPCIPLHTCPGSTLLLLGHPSILDLPVQHVILPIAHHCDMLLDVTAWSYTSRFSPVSMRKAPPLFHDNLLGITEVLAALCVKDEEKSFLGWSVVWRGRRKASSLSPWRSDELGVEENTACRPCSQQHFDVFEKKIVPDQRSCQYFSRT